MSGPIDERGGCSSRSVPRRGFPHTASFSPRVLVPRSTTAVLDAYGLLDPSWHLPALPCITALPARPARIEEVSLGPPRAVQVGEGVRLPRRVGHAAPWNAPVFVIASGLPSAPDGQMVQNPRSACDGPTCRIMRAPARGGGQLLIFSDLIRLDGEGAGGLLPPPLRHY